MSVDPTLPTEPEVPANRRPNFWGQASLTMFLTGLLVGYVANIWQSSFDEITAWPGYIFGVGFIGGIVLAVISLIRREPRGLAITTLVIAGVIVLLYVLLWMILWWMFASQPPCEGGPFCFNRAE